MKEIASRDGVVIADSSRYGSGNVHVHRQLTVDIDAEIPRRVDDWYDSGQQRNVFDDDLVQLLQLLMTPKVGSKCNM